MAFVLKTAQMYENIFDKLHDSFSFYFCKFMYVNFYILNFLFY